jgi:hypothetical protein
MQVFRPVVFTCFADDGAYGTDPETYRDSSTSDLQEFLLDKQDYFVTTGAIKPQTAANRGTALRSFLRSHSVDVADVVGAEMRMKWPDCLEKFLTGLQEQGKSPRDISNTKSALMPWRQMVREDDDARAVDAGKPTIFQSQLKELIGERPVSLVSDQANVPVDMLRGWLAGKLPRVRSAVFIARLERFFAVPSGELASIAGVANPPRLRPAEVGSPPPNEYRATLAQRTKDEYWLKPHVDSPLRKQWVDFMRYKTEDDPLLERSMRGKWRISPLPLETPRETNWFLFLDGAEVPSAYAAWAKVGGYLGWLALPQERGGMGFTFETVQTMAWLAVPELVAKHLEWKKERIGKYSSGYPEYLGWLMSLVRPIEGYFPQNPWLRETLPEEYRQKPWEEMCAAQMKRARRLIQSKHGEIEVSRDPFAPIAGVLDLPEPMEALVDMINRMRAERPVGNPVSEAIWARDLVLVKLFVSNPLRRRMYAHMSWKPDNTGHLYQKVDGSWWIKWKSRYFKNAKGAAADMDYDSPVHPNASNDIERYLKRHRSVLMRAPTDLVFLSSDQYASPEQPHRPWKDLSVRISTLTERYLYRCPGVGAHGMRHLVGSSIIKAAPGEMHTVAKVLNDRVTTVEKHYARFSSGDGARRMGDILGKSLNRM